MRERERERERESGKREDPREREREHSERGEGRRGEEQKIQTKKLGETQTKNGGSKRKGQETGTRPYSLLLRDDANLPPCSASAFLLALGRGFR